MKSSFPIVKSFRFIKPENSAVRAAHYWECCVFETKATVKSCRATWVGTARDSSISVPIWFKVKLFITVLPESFHRCQHLCDSHAEFLDRTWGSQTSASEVDQGVRQCRKGEGFLNGAESYETSQSKSLQCLCQVLSITYVGVSEQPGGGGGDRHPAARGGVLGEVKNVAFEVVLQSPPSPVRASLHCRRLLRDPREPS